MNIEALAEALAPLSAKDKRALAALLAPKPKRKPNGWDGSLDGLDLRTAAERWLAGEDAATLPKSRTKGHYRRVLVKFADGPVAGTMTSPESTSAPARAGTATTATIVPYRPKSRRTYERNTWAAVVGTWVAFTGSRAKAMRAASAQGGRVVRLPKHWHRCPLPEGDLGQIVANARAVKHGERQRVRMRLAV